MIGENIHTINLGKVTLSQSQHRAVRAINIIREYVRKHKNTSRVKIDQDLAHLIWAKGVRRPPRKITVELIDDGVNVLVVPYSDAVQEEATPLKEDVTKAIDSEDSPIDSTSTILPAAALPDKASDDTDTTLSDTPDGAEDTLPDKTSDDTDTTLSDTDDLAPDSEETKTTDDSANKQ